jgi:hypothetical protein
VGPNAGHGERTSTADAHAFAWIDGVAAVPRRHSPSRSYGVELHPPESK